MRSSTLLRQSIVALKAWLAVGASFQPDIRADTNRDGVVDMDSDSDSWGKAAWSEKRGAIFLPNVGDKHSRCPNTDLNGAPLSNDELAYCSDASGHLLLAPEYVAPLRTVPFPDDISDGVTAHIYATPRAAYERVRIFLLDDLDNPNATESWRLVDKQFNFNATQLRAGLTLGIDGREFVKEAEIWDGQVMVNFDVYDTPGSDSHSSDAVALKIAPVLTHHHLQRVETLISTAGNETQPVQQYFVEQLDSARVVVGIENPLYLFNQSSDIWAQDILEPAYASMPGPDGPVAIRIMLRSAQSTRILVDDRSSSNCGDRVSGVSNPARGVLYKAGRVIQGKHYDSLPAQPVRDLIFSQGVQSTLFLETGWLRVGHVDEFVQFVPYDNELGFTIAIASPDLAISLLEGVQNDGHGEVLAISFDAETQLERFEQEMPPFLNMTINAVLSNTTFIESNSYAQKWIDANLDILLSEIPLDHKDVIHVPCLFRDRSSGGVYITSDGLDFYWPPVLEGERQLGAFIPGSINGIVVGHQYISPNPFGPVIDGQDIIATAVEEAYGRAGMNVTFIDDYFSHHMNGGEVHCGSNTLRQTDIEWWE